MLKLSTGNRNQPTLAKPLRSGALRIDPCISHFKNFGLASNNEIIEF